MLDLSRYRYSVSINQCRAIPTQPHMCHHKCSAAGAGAQSFFIISLTWPFSCHQPFTDPLSSCSQLIVFVQEASFTHLDQDDAASNQGDVLWRALASLKHMKVLAMQFSCDLETTYSGGLGHEPLFYSISRLTHIRQGFCIRLPYRHRFL